MQNRPVRSQHAKAPTTASLLRRTLRSRLSSPQGSLGRLRNPTHPSSHNHSTLSSPSFLYEMLENVERLDYYRSGGGYHSVQIGDRFCERYRVVHKLGYGAFSTIWLARDERVSKYVAIKVCCADEVHQEEEILSRFQSVCQRGSQGPNRRHSCFVTSPARCSLADTREASTCGLFKLDVARSLAAQLTRAVAYIHEQGLVHGLYAKYGPPEPESVVRLDGQPLSPGVPSDVWSLGCTIWALLSCRPLLEMMLKTEDDATAQLVDILGPLPAEWWGRWPTWGKFSTQPGEDARPVEGRWVWGMETRFEEWVVKMRREDRRGMGELGEEEGRAFLEMVRGMLAWRPEDRLTTRGVYGDGVDEEMGAAGVGGGAE
ncbi:Serine/threonine-protein kinase spk-1 [Staphylotrichum tortipilum]|uniref:Serine/threonine-protein kinase spk-1 n=1 Tax=Staphylotrichum tortipilum TaxID=2831512 RepID=A0AAN6MQC3_9PEZI|nr:Serine/threonine-protein kinase spk-1 [Staphylotrichum longicolle]